MNKIKIILKILLSSKSVVITHTGHEDYPWLASLQGVDDEEFNDLLDMDWSDV